MDTLTTGGPLNRTDRLLAIVLELQTKNRLRAEDLAVIFEVSKRTVYRDIQSLAEIGVPVVSIPGQGYSLVEGYFLPPLRFTTDEATVLLIGSDFIARNLDADAGAAALSAGRKIEALLPEKLRQEVQYLQENIRFIAAAPGLNAGEEEKLRLSRSAMLANHKVRFQYTARSGATETRTVDPYSLTFVQGSWYLVGYDAMRQDMRRFRLERMDEFVVLQESFMRDPGRMGTQSREEEGRNVVVRVLFDMEIARWVSESRFFYLTRAEETPEGLLVTLLVRQEQDALPWLLSWGGRFRVVEPQSLAEQVAAQARAILKNHAENLSEKK
jgi:predicted DNA-binding transcriptional regulator YafY